MSTAPVVSAICPWIEQTGAMAHADGAHGVVVQNECAEPPGASVADNSD
jgi:hypothetical protein